MGIIISVIMITVFLLAFIIMAKFDEEEKSGETRVVCFVFSCSCFVFVFVFLVKRFQSIFLIFIIFLFDRNHYRGLKNVFFSSFSQHCGFCLFVCFCVVTQNFETGDESRSAEQKSFFSFSSGHHKINRWAWLGNLYGCPAHFFSFFSK